MDLFVLPNADPILVTLLVVTILGILDKPYIGFIGYQGRPNVGYPNKGYFPRPDKGNIGSFMRPNIGPTQLPKSIQGII